MAWFKVKTFVKLYFVISCFVLSTCYGFNTWDEYWNEYESSNYFPRLYPYREEFHDSKYESGDGFNPHITFKIPYFGTIYSSLFVNTNGHVDMSLDVPPTSIDKLPRTKWPNGDYPNTPDPPLLSPYFNSWELNVNDADGNIFWRVINPDTDETDISSGMLSVLSQEVRQHIVGGERFHAKYGVIITWDNMYFLSCPDGVSGHVCPRNTVQLAVVTDEVHTYVTYNYYNLTWIGSITEGCDPYTGLRGEHADCFAAQAGFNVGEARYFLELPNSNTDSVVNLDIGGNTGVAGRYIYDMSGLTPTRGGCTDEEDPDPYYWKLEVYPQSISMNGGEEVYFAGPCLKPENQVRCKFGPLVVPGMPLAHTQTKGMCISPRMGKGGVQDFCVSTNGGESFPFCSKIHVVQKYYFWPKIHLYNSNWEWYSKEQIELMFKWNANDLVYFHEWGCAEDTMCNSTAPNEIPININLLGFTEEPNENGTMMGIWQQLEQLEVGMENSGEYSFNTAEIECTVDCGFEKPMAGIIEITVTVDDEMPSKSIYSEAFPLGWYQHPHWEWKYGEDWPKYVCIDWSKQDREDTSWQDDLSPCPMTRGQAYMDIGQFIYPNPDCKPEQPCPMKPRPDHHIECADAIVTRTNHHGSVSSCCYPPELQESLSYGLDSTFGSASTRSSPYTSRNMHDVHVTQYYSFWIRDRVPYIMCCNWTGDNEVCMEQYMANRPTLSGNLYNPPKYAIAYGDPHFFTFDGTEYMFNGHGEFWLLRVVEMEQYDNFNLQGRLITPTEQPGGTINATMIVALAMQEGATINQEIPKIEVQVNNAQANAKLLLLVNGAVKDFSKTGLMYQEFYSNDMSRRIIVQNNDPTWENRQSNFTIIFENGIAVQVAHKDGFIHTLLVVPYKYFGHTTGLFGLWNDDPEDDLRSADGQLISTNSSTEYIHKNFGVTWIIDYTDSRFTYRGAADYDYFKDENFVPNFEEPEGDQGNITDEEVTNLCGDNAVCRFDYKTTRSKEIANTTMQYQLWFGEIQRASERAIACPYLTVSNSYRTVNTYLVGGEITFTGCFEGYTLRGHSHYQCTQINQNEAEWAPYIDVECKSNEEIEKEKQKLLTATLVPIFLILLIAILVIGGFIYYKKRGASKVKTEEKPPSYPGSSLSANRNEQFESMADKASRSQSLASSNVSFGSVILTEQITAARPPRPQSKTRSGLVENPPHNIYQAAPLSRTSSRQGSQIDLRPLGPIALDQQPVYNYANMSRDSYNLTGSGIPAYTPQPHKANSLHSSRVSLASVGNSGLVNQSFEPINQPNSRSGSTSNLATIIGPGIVNRSMHEQEADRSYMIGYHTADV